MCSVVVANCGVSASPAEAMVAAAGAHPESLWCLRPCTTVWTLHFACLGQESWPPAGWPREDVDEGTDVCRD